jgi:hypothetical protein
MTDVDVVGIGAGGLGEPLFSGRLIRLRSTQTDLPTRADRRDAAL